MCVCVCVCVFVEANTVANIKSCSISISVTSTVIFSYKLEVVTKKIKWLISSSQANNIFLIVWYHSHIDGLYLAYSTHLMNISTT